MEQRSIFVLMPFRDEFDDVYLVVRDAVAASSRDLRVDIECSRADEISRPGRISEQILESIKSADLIIADLTGNNPNVMYELGYAHALGRPAVILNQDVHQAPFDVKDFRQILYDRGRLMKDCRPRIISAISDLFGSESLDDQASAAASVEGGDHERSEVRAPSPLRPGSKLVALLQSLNLKLQIANKKSDGKMAASLGKQVRELLDRVTVVSAGDVQDIRNTAAVAGNCGVELERADLQAEAENVYRRAIGLFPDFAGLHFQYSDLLVDLGRLDEAASELERGRRLNPAEPNIGKIEMKMALAGGKPTLDLGPALQKKFEENPGDSGAALAYLLFLDRTGASLAEFETACKKWEAALPAETRGNATRALADRLASNDDKDSRNRAIQMYETMLPTTPSGDRHAVLHNLATLYAIAGEREQAKAKWTEAYRIDPGHPAVQAAFSQRLASWGDLDLAVKVAGGEPI
jgi:tetratricopeptide (TPR) repeat protein